jgi:hypothetical protein
MSKEFPCIESMLEVKVGRLLIRIWRDAESLEAAANERSDDIFEILNRASVESTLKLQRELCALPRINAVHISENGRGVVAYVNWP